MHAAETYDTMRVYYGQHGESHLVLTSCMEEQPVTTKAVDARGPTPIRIRCFLLVLGLPI